MEQTHGGQGRGTHQAGWNEEKREQAHGEQQRCIHQKGPQKEMDQYEPNPLWKLAL